ncbi:hypothetical protein [Aquimarina sp. SS2-1]|uniref:hypothetical protein n=1 Tax=Aquimarina besae TaxID=3342247 RepID=UPI00366AD42B
MKFLTYVMMAFALVFTTASCDGEDGMDGAEGPQGPAGQDGNANVIVRTVDNVVWTEASYLGRTANQFVITDNDITQDVLDNSLILVYFQLFGDDIWYPMTYSFPYASGDSEMITFTYSLNTLSIYALSTSGPLNSAISQLKYVIIEGTQTSAADFNSFEELQSYYNLD